MRKSKWDSEKDKMYSLWLEGSTFEIIGQKYGITKARVAQIFDRYFPERGKYTHANVVHNIPLNFNDLDRAKRERFRRKKQNAKLTGYEWSLEFRDVSWPEVCPILGIKLNYFAESMQEDSASFDRQDPSLGYTKENTRIVSWRANRIKNNGTSEEHRKIADYIDYINTKL